MLYNIINDREEFKKFINILPEPTEFESYYISLFARKKYNSIIPGDKAQLKRLNSDKKFLESKVSQLECRLGAYTVLSNNTLIEVPQDALALYISTNPRCYKKTAMRTVNDLTEHAFNQTRFNPRSVLMNNMQVSYSRMCFKDFDIDIKVGDKKDFVYDKLNNKINLDCIKLIDTRGGFHLLVELSKIEPVYVKYWHGTITTAFDKLIDQKGDLLCPVPGTTQGGYIPRLITF